MTQIFQSYSEFLAREDKDINGVSPEFAERHPNYEEQNETNDGCWNCSRCSDCSDCSGCSGCSGCSRCSRCSDCSRCSRCSDCSRCSGCSRCSDCSDCSDCSGCSRCSDCSDCSDCSGCSRCSDCSDCSDLVDASPVSRSESNPDAGFKVPTIEGIHQKVRDAIEQGGRLEMGAWHTCDTTHCRAGWVVHLAGDAGRKLEEKTSTPFAAMQIYHVSCPEVPVSPVRFYESNQVAMADIVRCAEEEAKLSPSTEPK